MEEESPATRRLARFGAFELDVRTQELRKGGARLRVTGQPLQILQRLVERAGDLVTRDELQHALWSEDTFVDFERNLNSAIKRLRAALGDSAETPRLIETLPKRGYRFLAPVEWFTEAEPEISQRPAAPIVSSLVTAASADVRTLAPETPPPAIEAGAGVPRGVRRRWILVGVALVAVAAALAAWRPTRARPRVFDTIAVLPFVVSSTASPTGSDDYLGYAIAEALTTELVRLQGVRIIFQSSSLRYAPGSMPLRQIANDLHADAIVEGSVTRQGDRITTVVQLIDTTSDTHVWAQSYEGTLGGILDIAGEAARALAEEAHVPLSPRADRSVATAPARSNVSEAYLKGRYHLAKGTPDDFAQAKRYFEDALAIDPSDARAHSGLADYFILDDTLEPEEAFRSARAHALRALALDDHLPDAHASLAFLRYYADWDWAGAEQEFKRAIELNPGNARARGWYALLLSSVGRHQEAEEQSRLALAIDPVAVANYDVAAGVFFNAREYEKSIAASRNILRLDRFDLRGFQDLSLGLLHGGNPQGALDTAEKGLATSPSDFVLQCVRAMSLHRLGRVPEAEQLVRSLEREGDQHYLSPVFFAMVRADFAQPSQALDLLERAFTLHDPYLVLLHVSPLFDGLRVTPRFRAIEARMKFSGAAAPEPFSAAVSR